MFNEFMQFNRNTLQGGGGSGLGLWICKNLATLHGGRLVRRHSILEYLYSTFTQTASSHRGMHLTFELPTNMVPFATGFSLGRRRHGIDIRGGASDLLEGHEPSCRCGYELRRRHASEIAAHCWYQSCNVCPHRTVRKCSGVRGRAERLWHPRSWRDSVHSDRR